MRVNEAQIQAALEHLLEHGYAILPGVLDAAELSVLRQQTDAVLETERAYPFEPEDGPVAPEDEAIEDFLAQNYTVSQAELARLMRRVRHTRASQYNTPWPVDVAEVHKLFLQLPTLFDQDRSQRIWNVLNKVDAAACLVEDVTILGLVRQVLGADCVLSDCSATSIGPGTEGGAWHVDVPLGQLEEPLPDFPLTTQNIWMLDDFTPDNGATRVVPGSHRSRRKPQWGEGEMADEMALSAPAGSVAMWLSNTWHRSGPNVTALPRRALICYYCRAWIKTFNNFQDGIAADKMHGFSPTLRYLLGCGAQGLVRG
jgi:ectoine hydroxylase-related dioxygenase (phytanoyl-CoA dioxygenase family)